MRLLLAALALLPAPALADLPSVAADIAPVHSLVARVMQGLGEPSLVTPPGASPHGYAMRPSEAAALQDADLVVWVGEALTPWLEEPLGTLAGGDTLELLSVEGTHLLAYEEQEAHGDHEEKGHDHGPLDPHAWLDPANGRLWLAAIAEALAGLDPENAEAYRANARAGGDEIDAAAAEAEALLAAHGDAPLVVYHDAYRYLQARFDLPPAIPLAPSDAVSPSAAQVAEVAAHVRDTGARCVFAEPQFSPSLVATVAEGTEARTAILDPLGGDLAPGPQLYPDLIRNLARTIAECAAA